MHVSWHRRASARAAFALASVSALTIFSAPVSVAASDTPLHVTGFGPVASGAECTSDAPYFADNAPAGVAPLRFSGDLDGCYYTDTSDPFVVPAGQGRYRLIDRGAETFVGTVRGEPTRFRSSYVVIALFEGNPLEDPSAVLLEGGCVHPLIDGGHGVLRFVDDVSTGLVHYSGVLSVNT
jgi:hypothetical protein